jgi:hypothetical protein
MNATWSVASRKLITAGAAALLAVAWCVWGAGGRPASAATQTKQRRWPAPASAGPGNCWKPPSSRLTMWPGTAG